MQQRESLRRSHQAVTKQLFRHLHRLLRRQAHLAHPTIMLEMEKTVREREMMKLAMTAMEDLAGDPAHLTVDTVHLAEDIAHLSHQAGLAVDLDRHLDHPTITLEMVAAEKMVRKLKHVMMITVTEATINMKYLMKIILMGVKIK